MFHFTKKKTIICVISLILSILCCFMTACCRKIYYWEVSQSIENISKIEIVEIDDYQIKDIICEMDAAFYEEVVNDVQSLPAHKYFGELESSYGKSIKITFIDGKYDIISLYEPKYITEPYSDLVIGKNRHYYYEKEDFDLLIEKWTNKQ